MRPMSSLMCLALLNGALIACGGSGDAPTGITVTDSAGVEIVTNERTFAEVPLRTIADAFERELADEALYQVTAVLPGPDGGIYVGLNGSGSVLLFDAAGTRVSTFGRMGDGPGEFRSIGSLVPLHGDSLGVYDPLQKRLTVVDPLGGAPRVVSLDELAPGGGWSRLLPLNSGLALVGEAGPGGGSDHGVYRNRESSYRIDLDGQVQAKYGDFPGLQAFFSNGMMGRAPFGALLASSTSGDQFIVGTGEGPELRVYGPAGDLTRIVRWADVDRTVTRERMSQYVDFMLSLAPPEQASAMRSQIAGMPFAPQMPAYSDVLGAPGGAIWVGEYPGPEAELPPGRAQAARQWVVFGPDGAIQERLQTPRGFMPFALAENLVWGVYQNEMDVESLRAYRIGL